MVQAVLANPPLRLDLLEETGRKQLRPSDISFCAAMSSCKMPGEWEQALRLMSRPFWLLGSVKLC